tara:strand:+ start:142 stop:1437 length:1296 start_codon:yes stop_codon:yes gene_type:complete
MTATGKHLTQEDRHYIEDSLNENCSLTEIAKYLGKDPTTISKEVKRNRVSFGKVGHTGVISCKNRTACNRKQICSETCNHICKKCTTKNCYRICSDYTPKTCTKLMRFPHVCNGCTSKSGCKSKKYRYRAKVAHANYIETLKTSREGIDLTPEELCELDKLITPLLLKGQSITHIYAHHKHEIKCSKRTLYTYVEQNLFKARNIDLPRKVRHKPRRKRPKDSDRSSKHRKNRTYEDFNRFVENNPEKHVVEMDVVEGKKSGKVFLTIFFRNSSLMLIFLLDSATQASVKQVFDRLYNDLGANTFKKTFPVILTDNGSEFKAPEVLEKDSHGNRRTHIFYCDPRASHQKGRIEKNHEYIRYILPQGQSFDHLTEKKVTLIMNHINSAARASLNDNTPFKLAQMLIDDRLLKSCLLEHIPADDVHLKPALLKA